MRIVQPPNPMHDPRGGIARRAPTPNRYRILLAGSSQPSHVGAHFMHAAYEMVSEVHLCNTDMAFSAPWAVRQFSWRLCGHRPPRIRHFNRHLLETCRTFQPNVLLATGLAPLDQRTLEEIGTYGIVRINYLTDDPWNPAHKATWFFDALASYDHVFSPRHSNLADIGRLGCDNAHFLPFAYSPAIHFPEHDGMDKELPQFACDIAFVGGADRDRVNFVLPLIAEGFDVRLYGGYWSRFRETRKYACGQAASATLRKVVRGAKISLCLVRRANRDGHSMRSYEIPAMGGCMLAEDTEDHRTLFGPEGTSVQYFTTPEDLLDKAPTLLARKDERRRMANTARERIVDGANTYGDRLTTMIKLAMKPASLGKNA